MALRKKSHKIWKQNRIVRRILLYVTLFIMAVGSQIESLRYWYTTPDTLPLIYANRADSVSDLATSLTTPLDYNPHFPSLAANYYRPVSELTFTIDYWLWGFNPFGYHLTNVILHGVVAVFVAITITKLTERFRVGILSGFLFAIHPISIEVVPAIARRMDMLVALFTLITLWSLLRAMSTDPINKKSLALSIFAYLLALLSKETAFAFLPVIISVWFVRKGNPRNIIKSSTKVLSPYFLLVGSIFLIRSMVVDGIGRQNMPTRQLILIPFKFLTSFIYYTDTLTHFSGGSPIMMFSIFLLLTLTLVLFTWGSGYGDHIPSVNRSVGVSWAIFLSIMAGLTQYLSTELLQPLNVGVLRWYLVTTIIIGIIPLAILLTPQTHKYSYQEKSDVFTVLFIWLLAPITVFLISKNFSYRSAYPFVISYVSILAILITNDNGCGGSSLITRLRIKSPLQIMAIILILIHVPSSPVVTSSTDWDQASDTAQESLTRVSEKAASAPNGKPVNVHKVPLTYVLPETRLGQPKSPSMVTEYTVRVWLRHNTTTEPQIESVHKKTLYQRYNGVYADAADKKTDFEIVLYYKNTTN